MNRLVLFILVLFPAIVAQAVDFLPKPGSQKGKIVFVNSQKRIPESEILAACREIEKATKCKVVVGAASDGQVSIEVTDDAESPALVAYPEDYKAKVNVAKMDKDLKGKALEKFFVSRCRKEMLRAFCFACGAGGSQYPNNIMSIGGIPDLDLVEEFIPGDTAYACIARLAKVGVTPTKMVPYARACREGWAPAPTNEVQKAIWDKVHAIPDKPITIDFDPKKDK